MIVESDLSGLKNYSILANTSQKEKSNNVTQKKEIESASGVINFEQINPLAFLLQYMETSFFALKIIVIRKTETFANSNTQIIKYNHIDSSYAQAGEG